ncbi:glycosyltransferase [Polaribacter sp. WD7]|uniref:glycosyltransferase n=1 Tax=Polaribacter sp. WD7 TaxID=2269061 RepID=UPI000DF3EAC5|nr:glycosyltransferase [Polaribacter sp. WD7]RCS26634.1 glycosyltransferase [Polaribacter sp. WD7]
MPVLNNLDGLKKSIESISSQIFKDYEVWIIDGGSTKKTKDYLASLVFPFFWLSEKDSGIYDAMNKGLQYANGEWVYFLGSGDEFNDKQVLQTIFSKEYQEGVSIISGSVLYEGDAKPFIYSKTKTIKNPSWNFSMWIRNGLHHQATFYKKILFVDVKYDLNYPIFSDYWFNLLQYKNKVNCFLLSDVIAKCTSDGVSKLGSKKNYKEEVQFKTHLSSSLFAPVFYLLVTLKMSLKKLV